MERQSSRMAGRQSRSDEEDLIDEADQPRYFKNVIRISKSSRSLTCNPSFEKVPTLPAAIIQVILCIAQIGRYFIYFLMKVSN